MFAGAGLPNISPGKISKCTSAARAIARDLPRIPLTQRQEYTPREDVIKYVRRPGRILTPARTCVPACVYVRVSHAENSLRERAYVNSAAFGDCHSDEEEQPSIRTPAVTKS